MGPLKRISGNLVDLHRRSIVPATLHLSEGRIRRIDWDRKVYGTFLVPGFIDAHVHIESSLLVPSSFARLALVHGTVATVSDPHEIANVLGLDGIRYLLEDAARVPLRFFFGAPSCVPASPAETAGAVLAAADVDALLDDDRIRYLGEMMNVPGVLAGDPEVLAKLAAARRHGKPVDGHGPGLRLPELRRYAEAGISTDHETVALEEGREKLAVGMRLLLREGSAARNFDALAPLLGEAPERLMFCSDDKHPHELAAGNINDILRRAVALGFDPLTVLACACLHPVRHYRLREVGLLRENDPADFVELDDLREFRVRKTVLGGRVVAQEGRPLLPVSEAEPINHFAAHPKRREDFAVPARKGRNIRVIRVIDGQVLTDQVLLPPTLQGGEVVADVGRDLMKLAVVNRYRDARPAIGFVQNLGLCRGALASSVAHDAHHIVAAGTNDADLCAAVNAVVRRRGGLCLADGSFSLVLPLPVAGLMTGGDGYAVAKTYRRLDAEAKKRGSGLAAPFLALSFLTLSVIPRLKLTDRGLFDAEAFSPVSLFV